MTRLRSFQTLFSSSPAALTRLLLGLLLVLSSAAACTGRSDAPPRLAAGVFAADDNIVIESELNEGFRRTARPGMGLYSDQVLTVPNGARIVLEDAGTRFHLLGPGRYVLRNLSRLYSSSGKERQVRHIEESLLKPAVSQPAILQVRYEPLWSAPAPGKTVLDRAFGDDSEAKDAAAFFFLPHSSKSSGFVPPADTTDPKKARELRVKPFNRPTRTPAGKDLLTGIEGQAAVEFTDHAVTFGNRLKFPVDLAEVERIVVLDGKVRLSLDGHEEAIKSPAELIVIRPEANSQE